MTNKENNLNSITFGKKYTFYNTKVAINFQAVTSRSSFNTINVEMAPKMPDGSVNWKTGKLSLQLSEVDAFKVFYCIINNKLLRYESLYHGEKNNKSVSFVENGQGGCNIKLSAKGSVLFFDLSPGQWFYGKLLLTEQILGLPVTIDDAKKLMFAQAEPEPVSIPFDETPLGASLNEIKALLNTK